MANRVLSRLHTGLGLGPLAAYLVYHLWQTWPALDGREAWLARHDQGPSSGWVVALVLLPMLVHLLLGGFRLLRNRDPDLEGKGRQRAQAVTGGLFVGFLSYHLTQVWGHGEGPHVTPLRVYDELWHDLGHPAPLALYVVGISAVCLHLAHGVVRVLERGRTQRSPRSTALVRGVTALLGLGLWLGWMQVLGLFALGEPLIAF